MTDVFFQKANLIPTSGFINLKALNPEKETEAGLIFTSGDAP
jgi:hypothetical protein